MTNSNRRTNFPKITDGLSKTFLVAENSYFVFASRSDLRRRIIIPAQFWDWAILSAASIMLPPGWRFLAPITNFEGGSDIAQLRLNFRALDVIRAQDVTYGSAATIPDVINVTMGDGSGRAISKDTDLAILEDFVTAPETRQT